LFPPWDIASPDVLLARDESGNSGNLRSLNIVFEPILEYYGIKRLMWIKIDKTRVVLP
jgi:hypothetical protein